MDISRPMREAQFGRFDIPWIMPGVPPMSNEMRKHWLRFWRHPLDEIPKYCHVALSKDVNDRVWRTVLILFLMWLRSYSLGFYLEWRLNAVGLCATAFFLLEPTGFAWISLQCKTLCLNERNILVMPNGRSLGFYETNGIQDRYFRIEVAVPRLYVSILLLWFIDAYNR